MSEDSDVFILISLEGMESSLLLPAGFVAASFRLRRAAGASASSTALTPARFPAPACKRGAAVASASAPAGATTAACAAVLAAGVAGGGYPGYLLRLFAGDWRCHVSLTSISSPQAASQRLALGAGGLFVTKLPFPPRMCLLLQRLYCPPTP